MAAAHCIARTRAPLSALALVVLLATFFSACVLSPARAQTPTPTPTATPMTSSSMSSSETDSGTSSSESVSSLSSPPSPKIKHGHQKTYKLSIGSSSVSETTDTSSVDVLPVINVDKIFAKPASDVSADTVYSSDAAEYNESSTAHLIVDKTEFRHVYVVGHSHHVPHSLMSEITSQFDAFDTIPASELRSSNALIDEENFHDDHDSDLVTGPRFAYQNVQCILPNGTAFPIPNVPCSRVHNHPDLCEPLCAREWQPKCTPTCYCRAGFNTLTFTEAAIINCTRRYFPAPARSTHLKTSGPILGTAFVAVPLLLVIVAYELSVTRLFYGFDPNIKAFFRLIPGINWGAGVQSV